jgi:hypothetical protein
MRGSYVVLIALFLSFISLPAHAQDRRVMAGIEREIEYLKRKFDWTVELNPPPITDWSFRPVGIENHDNLLTFLTITSRELAKHDADLLANAGPVTLNLVQDMRARAGVVRRYAAFVPEHDMIIVSIENVTDNKYSSATVHHELYHLLHHRFFGSTNFRDEKWAILNVPDFRYGKGGEMLIARLQGNEVIELAHPAPGFINIYSMTDLAEDQAELFASHYVDEDRRLVERFASQDPRLAAKLRYMQRITDYYSIDRTRPAEINYRKLLRAMYLKDVKDVEKALALPEKENPRNIIGPHDWQLAHLAVLYDHPTLLRDPNLDVHVIDTDGWTPLHYAVAGGKKHLVVELLGRSANPIWADRAGLTPEKLNAKLNVLSEKDWNTYVRWAREKAESKIPGERERYRPDLDRRKANESAWFAKLQAERAAAKAQRQR